MLYIWIKLVQDEYYARLIYMFKLSLNKKKGIRMLDGKANMYQHLHIFQL